MKRHAITQRGMVLILSLVFVLLLALVAGTVVHTATLQLQMAGNEGFREEANQLAQALALELLEAPGNFSLAGFVGHTNCASGSQDESCDSRELEPPPSVLSSSGYDIDYRITRQAPLVWKNLAVPGGEPAVPALDVAIFEIEVRLEARGSRRGRAHVIQGVAAPVPVAVPEGEEDANPVAETGQLYRIYWREPGVDPL